MLTIIVEACDCVGKSTLIGKLHQSIMTAYPNDTIACVKEEHFTYPPKNMSKEDQIEHQRNLYTTWVNRLNDTSASPRIYLFDRFMTGELIYGPMYRDYEPSYIHQLEMMLNPESTYFVTLCASPSTIKSRFDGEFINEDHIESINAAFIREYANSKIARKILINVDDMDADQVFNKVYEFIAPGLTRHIMKQMIRRTSVTRDMYDLAFSDGGISFSDLEDFQSSCDASCTKLQMQLKINEIKECVRNYSKGNAPGKFIYSGKIIDAKGNPKSFKSIECYISSFDSNTNKVIAIPASFDDYEIDQLSIHGHDITKIQFIA
jgi:thymidylate kinase